MRKHRTPLIVTACAGLLIALALSLTNDDEPRYNGRSLSSWVQAYSNVYRTKDYQKLTEAEQAISAIGTNAVPFLLKWIQQQPPSWQRVARKNLPDSITQAAPARSLIDGPSFERDRGATLAFRILGTNAAPAIPTLVALMTGYTNRIIAARAIVALSRLGAPALPHLAAALSNTNQTGRSNLPVYIFMMAEDVGTNACLSALRAVLQDQDPTVRANASSAIRALAPDLLTNTPPH